MLHKPYTLLYIRRNSIILAGKHLTPARLTFPENVVQNLEVRNSNEYTALCRAFFEEHGLKNKRILAVMDEAVVFTKTIELSKQGDPQKLLTSFTAAMPLPAGTRSCIGVSSDSELHVYGTNADLYTVLEESLKQCGAGKLLAVTPVAAYGLSSTQTLSTAIDLFLSDSTVRSHANFLTVHPQ